MDEDNTKELKTARMAEFGAILRQLREAKGYSQRALQEASGVNHAHIQQIEAGIKGCSTEAADCIRRFLPKLPCPGCLRGHR